MGMEAQKHNSLSSEEIKLIEESLSEGKGSHVKGNVVCLEDFTADNFPQNKDLVPYHLAIALEDENSLPLYIKLAKERRRDFLENCLRITFEAFKNGKIKKSKAAYFYGVVKYKIEQQKRLEEYKKRHYKHISLYGYKKEI